MTFSINDRTRANRRAVLPHNLQLLGFPIVNRFVRTLLYFAFLCIRAVVTIATKLFVCFFWFTYLPIASISCYNSCRVT